MQGLRNPEKRGVPSRTPQGRGMSVTQPFHYAQGREPVERQMVFDGESGKLFCDCGIKSMMIKRLGFELLIGGCTLGIMEEPNRPDDPNILWKIFSSLKLTLALLIVLAIGSVFGTLIPQQESAMELAHKLSPGLARLFSSFQLFDLYHSMWFRFIIALLAANLIVCSINRFPASLRRFRGQPSPERPKLFANLAPQMAFALNRDLEEVSNNTSAYFREIYKRVRSATTAQGEHYLVGERGRCANFGVYLVHLSVLLILLGGLVGSIFGFEAFVNVPEGATVEKVRLRKTRAPRRLPFAVRCDKFSLDFYPNGTPKEYRSDLSFLVDGKVAHRGVLLVNHPITFKGITFYQASYGTIAGNMARLRIASKNGVEDSSFEAQLGKTYDLPGGHAKFEVVDIRSNFMGMGPAVQVQVRAPSGRNARIWVFQNQEKIRRRFPGIFEKFPQLNPAAFEPFVFSLEKIESRYYTGLQVSKDPGVFIVWTGFFMIVVGLFVTFFMSHRRIWIRISKSPQGVRVEVAGIASRNKVGFAKELDRFRDKLQDYLLEAPPSQAETA